MKPEEHRIAIHKARGFEVDIVDGIAWVKITSESWGLLKVESPDYLNDLNAMHEAKKILTDEQRPIYWRTLYDVCKTTEWPFNAEAHQEAEAFLKTLNLWKY
jgi:hypothetical protein